MKKVLIVSPHFPPVNAADMQRVRMALPYFRECGWEPTVLCVDPDYVEMGRDPWLERALPRDISIVKTKALSAGVTRRFGFGSLSLRAFPSMRDIGEKLIPERHFDAAFFSTTQFGLLTLAPRWKQLFDLPYVLDMQDPWVSSYDYGKTRPPGGRLKYAFSQFTARRKEADVVRESSAVITVSPAYVTDLRTRYPDIPPERFEVLPFPGMERDFDFVKREEITQSVFNPQDGKVHWIYTGRGGSDMEKALSGFFEAIRQWRGKSPAVLEKLRMHFIGTSYAPDGKGEKTILPVAKKYGVEDLVEEITDRIPYFEVLRCMLDANALIVPGSDDAGYTASKIYPCILSGKPLLAVFHHGSSVLSVLEQTKGGTGIGFVDEDSADIVATRILDSGWLDAGCLTPPATIWENFKPYLAQTMTEKLCKILDKAAQR